MRRSFYRTGRINDVIQTALAVILQEEANELGIGMVTITAVSVSKDLAYAKVFVSVLNEESAKEILDALNNASKHLRYLLANSIKLRVTPELKFVYDDSILRGSRISSLINNALKDK